MVIENRPLTVWALAWEPSKCNLHPGAVVVIFGGCKGEQGDSLRLLQIRLARGCRWMGGVVIVGLPPSVGPRLPQGIHPVGLLSRPSPVVIRCAPPRR
ncbi:hypothetical protein M433DRAFT_469682 [Acidomyces richmondensis BFW]|nr:hypothetical protein M433DRAFT_469682 [Acidomyces richmondensis BFW]